MIAEIMIFTNKEKLKQLVALETRNVKFGSGHFVHVSIGESFGGVLPSRSTVYFSIMSVPIPSLNHGLSQSFSDY